MIERGLRVAAPAALTLFAVAGVLQSWQPRPIAVGLGIAVVASGTAIAWRRLTGWPLAAALAVPTAGITLLAHLNGANLGWFGICLIAGWVAFGARTGPTLTVCAVLVSVLIVQWIAAPLDPWGAWIAGTVFVGVGSVFTRRQRELVDQLRAAQAELADRARAEERNRLAAEMHDVIGHALTVSLLHVTSARLAVDEDPAEARASLTEAERLARQSLTEVRATVGLMREAETDDAPLPSAADVGELVESFRRAGSPVEFDVTGDPASLGAARGLAVYRIVQESLTNAARHGDATPVTVRLRVEPQQTRVSIANGIAAAPDASETPEVSEGSGLAGMRDRVQAMGGQLQAGPVGPDGLVESDGPIGPQRRDWHVEAVLPA